MWETICEASASCSGWNFGSKIPVYPILGFGPVNLPPPPHPPENWNLDSFRIPRGYHLVFTFHFQVLKKEFLKGLISGGFQKIWRNLPWLGPPYGKAWIATSIAKTQKWMRKKMRNWSPSNIRVPRLSDPKTSVKTFIKRSNESREV